MRIVPEGSLCTRVGREHLPGAMQGGRQSSVGLADIRSQQVIQGWRAGLSLWLVLLSSGSLLSLLCKVFAHASWSTSGGSLGLPPSVGWFLQGV